MDPSTHTEKPRRPPNSWILFRNAQQNAVRQERKAQNLSLLQADISKALSRKWRELSDIDKRPYEEEAGRLPRSKQQKEAEKQKKKEAAAVRKGSKKEGIPKLLEIGQVNLPPSTTSYLSACLQAQGFLPPDSGPSTWSASQTPQQIRASHPSLSPSKTPVELDVSHNLPTTPSLANSSFSTPAIVPFMTEAGPLSHDTSNPTIDDSPGHSFDYDFSKALYEKDVLDLGHAEYIDSNPSAPSTSTGLHGMASTWPVLSLDTAAIIKELEEYYASTSAAAAVTPSIPSSLQDVDISPKQVEPEQPACVAPSDLTLPEPKRKAARFRIVKLCTTKDRKNGKYIPLLKRRKRAKSALSTIQRLLREKDASDADKKLHTEDSMPLPIHIDPSSGAAESSSSGDNASPDWTMSDSFDSQYYPWDMPFGDSLYDLLTEDGGFCFANSSEDNDIPPPSQLWSDDIWNKVSF
ncbi:hypothetical protein EIP86_001434 [Pleurotus ostreatoroseus]|nr:hypothetical protein EIP86_001434 [Pleurotus ostreatoroseus]